MSPHDDTLRCSVSGSDALQTQALNMVEATRRALAKETPISEVPQDRKPIERKSALEFLADLVPEDLLQSEFWEAMTQMATKASRGDRDGKIVATFVGAMKLISDTVSRPQAVNSGGAKTQERRTICELQQPRPAALDMDTGAINDVSANRARIIPGKMTIRVRTVERMRSRSIPFTDSEYVSSPAGPIHDGWYTCLPVCFVGDHVRVLVFTSRQQTGFDRLDGSEYSRYIQVALDGSQYQKDPRSETVLFVNGTQAYSGSMLCLGEYLVHLGEYITIDFMTLTGPSLVRLRGLLLQNKSIRDGMTNFLESAGISESLAKEYSRLPLPEPGMKDHTRPEVARGEREQTAGRHALGQDTGEHRIPGEKSEEASVPSDLRTQPSRDAILLARAPIQGEKIVKLGKRKRSDSNSIVTNYNAGLISRRQSLLRTAGDILSSGSAGSPLMTDAMAQKQSGPTNLDYGEPSESSVPPKRRRVNPPDLRSLASGKTKPGASNDLDDAIRDSLEKWQGLSASEGGPV